MRMHEDEVETSAPQVAALVAEQFPDWSRLPVRELATSGTDHTLYRLGSDLVVRMPKIAWALAQADRERRWFPLLAPRLPLAVPQPVAEGRPGRGYPWAWSIYRWLPGTAATLESLASPEAAARSLASFLIALHTVDTSGGPDAGAEGLRGAPLARRDEATRLALSQLEDDVDVPRALEVWQAALEAAPPAGAPVWFHGDLLPGNLLVTEGKLSAVIDWGGFGVGDPAVDLLPAWSLFEGSSRAEFRAALAVDDAAWARGRGHVLSQAAIFLPYYRNTNPEGVAQARRTLRAAISDGS